jgi:hypothetical protein
MKVMESNGFSDEIIVEGFFGWSLWKKMTRDEDSNYDSSS